MAMWSKYMCICMRFAHGDRMNWVHCCANFNIDLVYLSQPIEISKRSFSLVHQRFFSLFIGFCGRHCVHYRREENAQHHATRELPWITCVKQEKKNTHSIKMNSKWNKSLARNIEESEIKICCWMSIVRIWNEKKGLNIAKTKIKSSSDNQRHQQGCLHFILANMCARARIIFLFVTPHVVYTISA